MASIAAMMVSASTVQALNVRPRSASFLRSPTPSFSTRRSVSIRCMAAPEAPKEPTPASPTGATPSAPTPTPAASSVKPISSSVKLPQAVKPKVSTNFGDVFAFSGPAPETINGRLAMLAFVTVLGIEVATGNGLGGQLENGGVAWAIVLASFFTVASLIPMFQGVTAESKSKSFWSSSAEKLNGRAAMLGLVALAITEFVKGSPLV